MATGSVPRPIELHEILREGVRITGILVVWGVLAILGIGVSNLGGSGSYLVPLGEALMTLFLVVGVANVLVYVIARGLQLSRR